MSIYMNYRRDHRGRDRRHGHEQWIDLSSFQWESAAASLRRRWQRRQTASPPCHRSGEVVVTKSQDAASPRSLPSLALYGEGKTVKIDFTRTNAGNEETYLNLELENCLVSGFSLSSGGDRPTESVSINFTKITYSYTPAEVLLWTTALGRPSGSSTIWRPAKAGLAGGTRCGWPEAARHPAVGSKMGRLAARALFPAGTGAALALAQVAVWGI